MKNPLDKSSSWLSSCSLASLLWVSELPPDCCSWLSPVASSKQVEGALIMLAKRCIVSSSAVSTERSVYTASRTKHSLSLCRPSVLFVGKRPSGMSARQPKVARFLMAACAGFTALRLCTRGGGDICSSRGVDTLRRGDWSRCTGNFGSCSNFDSTFSGPAAQPGESGVSTHCPPSQQPKVPVTVMVVACAVASLMRSSRFGPCSQTSPRGPLIRYLYSRWPSGRRIRSDRQIGKSLALVRSTTGEFCGNQAPRASTEPTT
mmetsp:Transcript_113671/g.253702  ORF Transcript_113671/g.253702 Transcript_113671/m.253702 type:complete len:261 (-) Transcript_113671:554-1336(-)